MRRTLAVLLLPLTLSGCSVFMAASSQEAPDLSALQRGTHQSVVDDALGRPFRTVKTRSGVRSTYQYFTGDAANYRRAAAYALLDGVTLGFAELVTFPAEAVQGDRHVVTIDFDRSRRVLASNIESFEAPLEAPERLVGLDHTLRPNGTGDFVLGEPAEIPAAPRQVALERRAPEAIDQPADFLKLPMPESR